MMGSGSRKAGTTHGDFDRPLPREGTGSVKWDRYRDTGIIPLWVADMDFAAPEPVVAAIRARLQHPVFGYTNAPEGLVEAVCAHVAKSTGWSIRREWIVWLPGLVSGLNIAARATGEPGDAVITATPVYPPFLSAPALSQRELITVPLSRQDDGRYEWDWDRLNAAVTPRTRLLLLCNPHNPVGRVWTGEELRHLAHWSERYGIAICSDEIHAGLVLDTGVRHLPIAMQHPELAERSITLMAPSKTFNIPGLGFSFAVIPGESLRRRFRETMKGIVPDINVFGYVAALAAYTQGEPWRQSLLDYLRGNRARLMEVIAHHPLLAGTHPEATYLAWVDARALGENPQKIFEKAGLGPSDGRDFGAPGFVRINYGCRRALLEEVLERLATIR
ncbi:MAG: PatB family C-S lyase [Gammaproteobacteria bacterium]|nr:PatB family C-S lyase [Gammaproteobacteria bacterium]